MLKARIIICALELREVIFRGRFSPQDENVVFIVHTAADMVTCVCTRYRVRGQSRTYCLGLWGAGGQWLL